MTETDDERLLDRLEWRLLCRRHDATAFQVVANAIMALPPDASYRDVTYAHAAAFAKAAMSETQHTIAEITALRAKIANAIGEVP